MDNDPYNQQVRACFENPVHAGDAGDDYDQRVSAVVAESDAGATLVLSAGIRNGKIAEMRFRAWGCPHLIAAAETVCAEFEGQPAGSLKGASAVRLQALLGVPVAKTGRMLLVEDALRSLGQQLEQD